MNLKSFEIPRRSENPRKVDIKLYFWDYFLSKLKHSELFKTVLSFFIDYKLFNTIFFLKKKKNDHTSEKNKQVKIGGESIKLRLAASILIHYVSNTFSF